MKLLPPRKDGQAALHPRWLQPWQRSTALSLTLFDAYRETMLFQRGSGDFPPPAQGEVKHDLTGSQRSQRDLFLPARPRRKDARFISLWLGTHHLER